MCWIIFLIRGLPSLEMVELVEYFVFFEHLSPMNCRHGCNFKWIVDQHFLRENIESLINMWDEKWNYRKGE